MNKVFKVIWNHATQTWTAVSELGHAKGKTKSKKIVKLTALAGAVIGSLAVSQTATAAADLGTNDAVNIAANNVPNPTAGREAIAVGQNANASHQHSIAIGRNATANWTNTISIGKDTVSSQDHAVAIGSNSTAKGVQSVGVGSYTKAEANLTVAVGPYAQASKEAAIAMGSNATAAESNSVAVGQTATASNNNAIAIGTKTKSAGDNAIGIGAYAESTAHRATAIGVLSQANGLGSFAGGASAQATGENSVAIGGAQDGTLGNKAGTAAKATGAQAIALGTKSNASGENSIAEGNGANASAANATAIGNGANASHANSVALGSGSVTDDKHPFANLVVAGKNYNFAGTKLDGVVSIGTKDKERQIQNVGAGRISSTSTDAINGSQLYAVADAVSNHHWVVGGNTTAQNTSVPQVSKHSEVKNKDIVEFQNGNGTKATIEYTEASQSSGTPAKTVVKYHANIVNGDNTEVVYNADGSVKINAKVAGGKDTTAAVTTNTTDALGVTSTTTGNVTTYNVDAKTGAISTTPVGSATYAQDGDKATGGNYGARLTNVSTVTDIVNNVSWHLNSSAVTGTNGKITEGSDTQAADVKASNTVNINAGKNIEIKRNGTTIEISSTAGEKGDTGATGAKGDTGATGAKGDTGAAGAKGDTGEKGEDGTSITGEVVDNGDGTHTITITDLGTGSVTTTIVKDGKNGKDGKDGATGAKGADGKNAEASVVNNGNGTHTVTIVDGNGQTTSTVVKDGKNAEADVKDNGNGTHTVTIKDGNGNTTTTILKDGATGAKGDTGATGAKGDTGATGADGKNAEADVKDNGDGTHTVTIKDGNGKTTTTVVKNGEDGKNAQAEVKDNKDGTHTVTITDGSGKQTVTTIKNGKDGRDGKDADGTFGLVDETGSSQGTITKKLNNTIQIKGDAGTKVKVYDKQTGKTVEKEVQNIFVKKDGDALKVSLNPDVTVNSVTTNELKAGPVTINQDGIDAGNKTIQNVAPGVKDTDAVNVSQLRSNITNVNNRINKVGKEARGGIAGANAAAGLPQVYIPGKSMVAASAGTFKGESAVAVGYSRSSDNGKVIFKLQGNANTQGDVGGSVGVGYQW